MAFVIDVQINVITKISNPLIPTGMESMDCYEKIIAHPLRGRANIFSSIHLIF
jgi:hypothetical protein